MNSSEKITLGRFEVHELPDGAVLYFDPKAHAYYSEVKASNKAEGGYSYARGSRLPGVSTISKFVDQGGDGLLYWAAGLEVIGVAELAAEAIEAEADLTWLGDPAEIRRRLKEAGREWQDVRDRAAHVGTVAHEQALQALAEGEVPDLATFTEAERPFARAVMSWWHDRAPVVLDTEAVTYSPSKGYAGRFDLRCRLVIEEAEVTVLVDAKTRDKGKVRLTDYVQLAGYEAANRECGIGGSDRQLALILMPDGTYREEWSVAVETDFYAALNAYNASKAVAKRMSAAEKAKDDQRRSA